MQYNILGETFAPVFQLPFQREFLPGDLVPIDLSVGNPDLPQGTATDLAGLAAYVKGHIQKHTAKGAWGGYGEKRDLYRRSSVFADGGDYRNIHLGIDFWLPAGTVVAAVAPGEVHSFADNAGLGNYGPTIVLLHQVGNFTFYSLYGHLSRGSLQGLEAGKLVRRGEAIGRLGNASENGDWPPHLHFQLVHDMEGLEGDYPGVCMEADALAKLANCPNPVEVLDWKL